MAESDFDTAIEDIFDELGRDATFTPLGGDPVPVKAHKVERLENQPDGYDSIIMAGLMIIDLIIDDLPRVPRQGDQIVMGTDTYTVQAPLKNDGRCVSVIVK